MDIILIPILQVIYSVLGFYQIVIFVNILFSWLLVFGIISPFKPGILANIFMISRLITEPVYNFVRRYIPTFGPIDFSPLVVILAIYILSAIIQRLIIKINLMSLY